MCSEDQIKILVVEDDSCIIESLKYILRKEEYNVITANNKNDAITLINDNEFDLFLLDVQLPDGTGFDICKYIRTKNDKPILFLSGRNEESNIVYGLDLGADDYITKPFGNSELISRIRCILRRCEIQKRSSKIISYKNIKIDTDKMKVYKDLEIIELTKLEYKILMIFIQNINKIITREEILLKIWDINGNYVNDNTVSVYIKRLRIKLFNSEEEGKQILQSVRGVGYILIK